MGVSAKLTKLSAHRDVCRISVALRACARDIRI
jgi:hypothetical protein